MCIAMPGKGKKKRLGTNFGARVMRPVTAVNIRLARNREGLSYAALSERFGVSKATVRDVVTRRTWRDAEDYVVMGKHKAYDATRR